MSASPPKTHRLRPMQLAIPLPPGVCWDAPAAHTRPGNTSPTRYAEIVRGALLERFERMTADGDRLRRIAGHFGLTEEKTVDLMYVLQLFLFPEEHEPDPEVEAEIIAMRGAKSGLVPRGGLERCSDEMFRAFAERVAAGR